MALKEEIKLNWVSDVSVNNCPGRTVSTPVCIIRILWEKPGVVSFPNNDHGDGGVDLEFLASI